MNGSDTTRTDPRPLLFVSYSRSDLERARPVIAFLQSHGFDVWWDGRLEGGENFLATTETALENATCVVALWSATSVQSHWVRDEAQRGRERGCLVPLSIDGTMAPLGFRQFQVLDITGWDGTRGHPLAERILVAVRARLGEAPGVAAPVPVPVAMPPPAARGFALSRRGLVAGGIGLAGAAGLVGAWRFGLIGEAGAASTSMVVLPFANETGDPARKYFSEGLAREVRAILSRNPRLRVAAPTSSSALGGEDDFAIGRKLGVAHILRGSVQRDTARVRVSAELVEIDGGAVRWAETYDRALADVFAVQSEIAQTVALSLVATVASDTEARAAASAQGEIGGTASVAAYEAFLRGMALYDLSAGDESDRAALAQFEAAVRDDPAYAAAHAMRATMLAAVANNVASDKRETRRLFDAARAAAERAIAIELRLARGHLALGFVLNNGRLDRAGAAPHYRAAQRLAPGDADVLRSVAGFLAYGPDTQAATRMIGEVLKLDPLNARAFRSAGYVALFARDTRTVAARMQRALALNPSIASAQFAIAIALLMEGDAEGALAAAGKEAGQSYALTATAIARHRLGDAAGSDAALQEIAEGFDNSQYQQAQVHAQRGEAAAALALLDAAWKARDPGLLWLANDPLMDPLRRAPPFAQLLLRLGS